MHSLGFGSLASLPLLRNYRSRRSSSFDTSGNNKDWLTIASGESATLLAARSPGCIRHIWMTVGCESPYFARELVLRMFWDEEAAPSVEVPLGDFFGIGHSILKSFVSAPLQMSPESGRGMNSWWPMPFDSALLTLENQSQSAANVYFYVDYEEFDTRHPPSVARFHAQWRREAQTEGWLTERLDARNITDIWSRKPNLSGEDNYLILEAEGSGVYVGCNLNIDCFQRQGNDWYGEGDDMIFIDGEPWPPRLHGTGTEDYFCMAFCPTQEYCAPFHGLTVYSGTPDWKWKGKNSLYRYHVLDPIRFEKSIRVSIEHGHANKLSNDYSSTAYWYQLEPHVPFPQLLPVHARLPRANEPGFPQGGTP